MSEPPTWKQLTWPTGLLTFQALRLERAWGSHLFKVVFFVTIAWALFSWINFLTRGKLTAWLDKEEEPLRVPDDFHAYCLKSPVTPRLKLYLSHLLEGGSPYDDAIRDSAGKPQIVTAVDAIAVCSAFQQATDAEAKQHILRLFFQCASQEAYACLYHLGVPQVHRHAIELDGLRRADGADRDILRIAPVLIGFAHPASLALVESWAHDPVLSDSYAWVSAFRSLNLSDPDAAKYLSAFTGRLPDSFAAVAFLDWANETSLDGKLQRHPFDTPQGMERLRRFLDDRDPDHFSYAVSATSALPFVSGADGLLPLAMGHPDRNVRLEAAWAGAKRGSEEGFEALIGMCLDWRSRERAGRYLKELGREDLVPEAARTPREEAIGAMAEWLAHPNELGKIPDSLEIVDHRLIHWPPANQTIPVTLLRWRLGDDAGIGMTGSVTWCFFSGEKSDATDPLGIYARHCKWELEKHEIEESLNSEGPKKEFDLPTVRDMVAATNPQEDWTATG